MNLKVKATSSILIALTLAGLILGIFMLPEDIVTDFILVMIFLMLLGYIVINFLID